MKTLFILLAVICTNCVNGKVEVKCERCKGRGVIVNSRHTFTKNSSNKIACPDCTKGLYNSRKKGEGKIKKKCEKCHKNGIDNKSQK